MGRVHFVFLLCFLIGVILESSSTKANVLVSYNWRIKINRVCTLGLYENDKTASDYKNLKMEAESSIVQLYRGNSGFNSSSVQLFNCAGRHVWVELVMTTNNISAAALVAFNNVFISNINRTSNTPSIMRAVLSYNLDAPSLVKREPSLYAKMSGSIAGSHFCQDRNGFKGNLARTLILSDGVSTASSSQVILLNHPCGGDAEMLLHNVQFYVAKANNLALADVALTNLAFKIVEQMIYDGTSWRLGLHLYKYLDSIELLGTARKDPGLSDLEIVYIGFGAVLGIIVLLILVVLIVDCCCPNCCGGEKDEKDFHMAVHIEPNSNEKGITNELFQTEKPHADVVVNEHAQQNHAYEEVENPLKISPVVAVVAVEPAEPEYLELKNVEEPKGNEPVVMGTFQDVDVAVEETPMEVVYDNPVESGQLDEELLPDPEFDSATDESDEDEGEDLNVDGLANALSDENGLLMEFDKLGNRVPGAMLYPEDVVLKNRVPGCFPWPESRVPLSVDDPLQDYINASYIKDNKGALAYIATQGPLQSTTEDFWKMIMERNVEVIVMVTPLSLRGQEMCYQYWPRDQAVCSYGDVKVQLSKKELKPDFLVMTVTASQGDAEPRQISLYRYMSWPQNDIPDNSRSIVGFLLEIREISETLHSFPVFHCSSGRGMAAVLIALYNGMISLEETSVANLKKIVRTLRKDLPGAVESYEQYKFLYEAMYQYALFHAS